MSYSRLANRLPRFLRQQVLYFETRIEQAVQEFAASLEHGARLLDAGAGETRYRPLFPLQRYIAVDLAVGDATWNYGSLDAVADLVRLPFRDQSFDAAIHLVTLEHLSEPACALAELARVLRPGARVLMVVPQDWEVHQPPHDYFRYTRFGLEYLLRKAGFEIVQMEAAGGYFRLMSRRILNGLQFFARRFRWLFFPLAALVAAPVALAAPALDLLDRERNFTLGYLCTARKPSL